MEILEKELQRARRYEKPLTLLIMDLDFFKEINDNFGHAVGDEALKMLTTISLKTLRMNDMFGRIGGDEFVAILPETDGPEAIDVSTRLLEEIGMASLPVGNATVQFNVSIGGSTLRSEDETLKPFMRRADEALYQAKERGRACVVVEKHQHPSKPS